MNPSPFFSQNMAALKQVFPQLAEEIGKADSSDTESIKDEELVIETAASGDPTLVCRGIYVHSKRDPKREAQRLVENVNDYTAAVLLGFGLGYTAAALTAKFSENPVIVVEKRPEIIKKALAARDLRELFSRKRLVFVLGGDGAGVTQALSLFDSKPGAPPLVLQNRALTSIDEDWYAAVDGRIKAWFTRTNVNRATQERFGKRWVRNLSQNLHVIRDIPGVSRLEGLLSQSSVPVFLAAAGPGLDAVSPILGEVYKRCLVVAVDTSLRFLVKRNIEADFVVSVDPQYWNYCHLAGILSPKTWLIAESATYPSVLRHSFGGAFLCGSSFPLGRYIEEQVDPKGDLGAGGSVATCAWDFCRHLGARQIWIAGLDLAFPELKTHYRGALFEEKSHAESRRLSPAETWNFRALRNGYPFPAKCRKSGNLPPGTVLTDKRLSLYASWFENRFSRFSEIKNLSLSDGGLTISGLENGTAEEILSLPERRNEINSLLAANYADLERNFYSKQALRSEKFENSKKNLLDGLRQIQNLALEAADNAGIAASRYNQGRFSEREQENVLKTLDSVNKTITESAVKEIAGFLFPETEGWEAEIALENHSPFGRHLEFSRRFYRSLAEAAEYNLLKLNY